MYFGNFLSLSFYLIIIKILRNQSGCFAVIDDQIKNGSSSLNVDVVHLEVFFLNWE